MTSWPSKSTLQRLLDLAGLHYTTSERSGPFWQSMLHNFLSRPLSFLGWTTAMLFWLDFHQTQSNLYKWFRMQRHDWSSTSPKEPMLHLSSSHCTGYQWQLASSSRHWCLHTERPQAQHPLTPTHIRIYIPSRSLRSASERRLVVPSQRGSKSLSRTFSFTIPGWWNNLPSPIRNAGSLSIWLPLQDESLYVFPNCKSLWIKASAKLLNVNVKITRVNTKCSFEIMISIIKGKKQSKPSWPYVKK